MEFVYRDPKYDNSGVQEVKFINVELGGTTAARKTTPNNSGGRKTGEGYDDDVTWGSE